MYRSSKTFRGYPCVHRKWRHAGHCSLLHGYSREFTVWFACQERDENGFVMDFGDLKEPRRWLEDHFDHTLLLDHDDPLIEALRSIEAAGGCKLIVLEDVSTEGSARHVYNYLNPWVAERTAGRVWVHSVECRENENNSGLFLAPPRE